MRKHSASSVINPKLNTTMKTNESILSTISQAYATRGSAKARAKAAGKLVNESVRHSGKSQTVKVGETYDVPADFTFSDAERRAIQTVDALERFCKLTGFSVENLKGAEKAKATPATTTAKVVPMAKAS